MDDCIFCKIVRGEAPCHKVWEDDKHLAFLSIFPNTPGFTVLITKEHLPSYFADNQEEVLSGLVNAAKKVAKLIDSGLDDVGRSGLIAEGFGVDHLHLKLFPMHGTKTSEWQQHNSHIDKIFDKYEGYISSHNGPRADDNDLEIIANKIKHDQ